MGGMADSQRNLQCAYPKQAEHIGVCRNRTRVSGRRGGEALLAFLCARCADSGDLARTLRLTHGRMKTKLPARLLASAQRRRCHQALLPGTHCGMVIGPPRAPTAGAGLDQHPRRGVAWHASAPRTHGPHVWNLAAQGKRATEKRTEHRLQADACVLRHALFGSPPTLHRLLHDCS